MELTIIRLTAANEDGVPGVMMYGVNPVCLTLEEEWKDNARSISCIPAGRYLCQRITRPSGQVTYEVMNVPSRSAILIHPGNTEEDIEGCILTGKEFGKMRRKDEDTGVEREKMAVLRSTEAFKEFMALTGGKETFALTIKWA